MYLILTLLVICFLHRFRLRYNLSFKEKIKLFSQMLIKKPVITSRTIS